MIEHVYRRVQACAAVHRVIVATDDRRVADAVHRFGGDVRLTRDDHQTGTDRIAEVAATIDCDVVVNVQGDEPMLDPQMLEEVVAPFRQGTSMGLVTLKKEVFHETEFTDPAVVKVVTDPNGVALYFSRSLIPYPRNRVAHFRVFEHVGIYAYTRECLLKLASLPVSPLEEVESLEQLRALENGIPILVVETRSQAQGISVDTQEDLERVRDALRGQA